MAGLALAAAAEPQSGADSQGTQPESPAHGSDSGDRETAAEISREIAQTSPPAAAVPAETPPPAGAVPVAAVTVEQAGAVAAPVTAAAAGTVHQPLPDLEVDLDDPTALMVTPTVLSVPNKILRRFEQARSKAPSHTGLVLDALRAHANELPALVAALRPGPRPGDLFPYRATPGAADSDRPGPLRIRPTAGELEIMDRLTAWVNDEIRHGRAGVRKVSRSEVVAVALNAYLPLVRTRR